MRSARNPKRHAAPFAPSRDGCRGIPVRRENRTTARYDSTVSFAPTFHTSHYSTVADGPRITARYSQPPRVAILVIPPAK